MEKKLVGLYSQTNGTIQKKNCEGLIDFLKKFNSSALNVDKD